jgi:hypothetical protein
MAPIYRLFELNLNAVLLRNGNKNPTVPAGSAIPTSHGPSNGEIMRDSALGESLGGVERAVWGAFKAVIENFIGNFKP